MKRADVETVARGGSPRAWHVSSGSTRDRALRLALTPILAGSFALNAAFVGWGLPGLWHPDEVVTSAWFMAQRASLEPVNYLYPTLHTYLVLFGVAAPHVAIRATLAGHLDVAAQVPPVPELTLDARLLTALMGTTTVGLVYALGARAFGRGAAILAAAFLASSAGFVSLSHFATVDVPLAFWSTAAFLATCRAHLGGSPRAYVVAAFLTGLATSTKYPGILLAVPLFASVASRPGSPGARSGSAPAARFTGVAPLSGLFVGLGFVCGTPGAVVEPLAFLHDASALLLFQPTYAGSGSRGFVPHLRNLAGMLGPFLSVVAVLGVAHGASRWLRTRCPVSGLLVLVVIVIYAAMGSLRFHPPRYVVSLLPFLALLAAVFVADALVFVRARSAVAHRIAILVLALGLATSVLYGVNGVLQLRDDDRVLAARWLARHVPRDASIELPPQYGPLVPRERGSVNYTPGTFRNAIAAGAATDPTFRALSRTLQRAGGAPADGARRGRLSRLEATGSAAEPPDASLEALLARRPEYLVLAERWYSQFLVGDDWPLQRELYEAVLAGKTPYVLVAAFEARPRWLQPSVEFVNGGIRIFRHDDPS